MNVFLVNVSCPKRLPFCSDEAYFTHRVLAFPDYNSLRGQLPLP